MKRLIITRYILLLCIMIFITICIHYLWITPVIDMVISNDFCNRTLSMLLVFVVEPIVCVLIDVFLIADKEKKVFNEI